MLSVVIPLWQDALTLPHTAQGVNRLRAALPYPVEVVAVDDGSSDDTAELAEALGYHLVRQPHRGRGAAIRSGMLAASGTYRLLIDPRWTIPPEQVQLLLPPALTGFDLALASRNTHGSSRRGESTTRRAASRALARLVQSVVLPGVSDVRSGFMCFRAEAARALFTRTREDGAAAEVEILALSRAFGLELREVAVDWRSGGAAAGSVLHDAPDFLAGLARVRARLATSAYPPLAGEPPEPFEGPHSFV